MTTEFLLNFISSACVVCYLSFIEILLFEKSLSWVSQRFPHHSHHLQFYLLAESVCSCMSYCHVCLSVCLSLSIESSLTFASWCCNLILIPRTCTLNILKRKWNFYVVFGCSKILNEIKKKKTFFCRFHTYVLITDKQKCLCRKS